MANPSLVLRYKEIIRKLLPQGKAWGQALDGEFGGLIFGLSNEAARVEERGLDFLREMDPTQTFEMLDNWERLLKLPDECTPEDPEDPITLFERRVRVLQKYTTGGGQNKAFFQLLANQLGYDINVLDVREFPAFRAGYGRAGDRITNSVNPNGTVNANGWAYVFAIIAPASLKRNFLAGQGRAGDRLTITENATLECVIRRFAPAHTIVLFYFE